MQQLTQQFYCTAIAPQIIADSTSRFLKFRRPDLYNQIDKEKSKLTLNLTDEQIDKLTYGSGVKLWWICCLNPCGCHKWDAQICDRVGKNSGCPFCVKGGSYKKTCIHSSFMNDHILAEEFDIERNIGVDPWKISISSDIELWWKCRNHKTCNEHIWKATLANRSKNSNLGCPWCYNKQTCKCSSFMNDSILASEFAYDLNQGIDPWKISSDSHIDLWWRCSKHKTCNTHIWSANLNLRNRNSNLGCPWCYNQNGNICQCNTFMNNPLLTLLRDDFDFSHFENVGINPYKLSTGSDKNVWWKCSTCLFSWKAIINSRSWGRGCPSCATQRTESKGEENCREYLNKLNIESYYQIKFNYIPSRRYDFGFNKDHTFLIEIDGKQHFKYISTWHKTYENFRDNQQVDKMKTLIPLILGYNILRISNDNQEHIKHCIDIFIDIKNQPEYSNIPLIVFDDYFKYGHLVDNFNSNLIRKLCNSKYHEEIIDSFIGFEINFYCIKHNELRKRIFDIGAEDGI